MNYAEYNREERNLCNHLFRLLHERNNSFKCLQNFVQKHYTEPIHENFKIYSEVALIRDAYYTRKTNPYGFLDEIIKLIMNQEHILTCRLFSQLPNELKDVALTHPKQILYKAKEKNINLTEDEKNVYGALQGMFNAKPDLAICLEKTILIYEAKFTLDFDNKQIERTRKIGKVWANILYSDLGYSEPPDITVLKLGLAKRNPDVSWEEVYEIAKGVYPSNDNSLLAFKYAANYEKRERMEE